MELKKKIQKKRYAFVFLLALILFPTVLAVEFESGTIITNYCLGYNFTLLSNLTADQIVVNSTCEGDINNLTAFYNPTLLEINNTNSADGIINVFDLTQALIFNSNGTLLYQGYTGDINLTIEGYNAIVIENNFVVDLPDGGGDEGGSGLNQDGGSGNTKINNTLIDSVLIKIYNLDNSFIYFSNGTILSFLDGDLNITLIGSEYFYIINFDGMYMLNENSGTTAHDTSGNDNHGTITGATWDNDGVLNTLTNAVDYTINTATGLFTVSSDYLYSWIEIDWTYYSSEVRNNGRNLVSNLSGGYKTFFGFSNTFFTIAAIVLLIFMLVGLLAIVMMIAKGKGDKNSGYTKQHEGFGDSFGNSKGYFKRKSDSNPNFSGYA